MANDLYKRVTQAEWDEVQKKLQFFGEALLELFADKAGLELVDDTNLPGAKVVQRKGGA